MADKKAFKQRPLGMGSSMRIDNLATPSGQPTQGQTPASTLLDEINAQEEKDKKTVDQSSLDQKSPDSVTIDMIINNLLQSQTEYKKPRSNKADQIMMQRARNVLYLNLIRDRYRDQVSIPALYMFYDLSGRNTPNNIAGRLNKQLNKIIKSLTNDRVNNNLINQISISNSAYNDIDNPSSNQIGDLSRIIDSRLASGNSLDELKEEKTYKADETVEKDVKEEKEDKKDVKEEKEDKTNKKPRKPRKKKPKEDKKSDTADRDLLNDQRRVLLDRLRVDDNEQKILLAIQDAGIYPEAKLDEKFVETVRNDIKEAQQNLVEQKPLDQKQERLLDVIRNSVEFMADVQENRRAIERGERVTANRARYAYGLVEFAINAARMATEAARTGAGLLSLGITGYITYLSAFAVSQLDTATQGESSEAIQGVRKILSDIKDAADSGIPGFSQLYDQLMSVKTKVMTKLGFEDEPITADNVESNQYQIGDGKPGKLRPKFISPSPDILDISIPELRQQLTQFTAFDYVPVSTEGAEGSVQTNVLKNMNAIRDKYRYTDQLDVVQTTLNFKGREGLKEYVDSLYDVDSYNSIPEMRFMNSYDDLNYPVADIGYLTNDPELMYKESEQYSEFNSTYPQFTEAYPDNTELANSYLYSVCP